MVKSRDLRSPSTPKLLLIFAVTFSLVALTGPLMSLDPRSAATVVSTHGPLIPSQNVWWPAGAQEQTLSISEGNGVTGTQLGWLQTGQVDAEDWPLTASEMGASGVNCAGSTTILCSLPIPDHSYFEIQFNLANVFWGIPMSYGNSPAGVELRQGIAHLINKQSFAANNAACLNVACISNDQPVSVCTTTAGCANGGLPAANPCNWDTLFQENSPANCIVGAPGGTAYNCAYSTACPTGTVTGTTTFPWQVAIGSPDFCAAAQHFALAFKMQFNINVTQNNHCELVSPTGGWPSAVTSINTAGCNGMIQANVCFMGVWTTEPRKSLSESLVQEICGLFSPAWGGWTTLVGNPVSCDNTNTGTSNAACGGGPCPFLGLCEGGLCIPPNLATITTGTPSNQWGIVAEGSGDFPFDSTTYLVYNSVFATRTDYTCNNGPCTTKTLGSTCASTTYTSNANDYMYLCSPAYDNLSSAMEFSTCLASPSTNTLDPTFNQNATQLTFATCSGTSVSVGGPFPNGVTSTTCQGASPACSATSAGYQAEDYFGSHAFTLPILSRLDVEARLSNWPQGYPSPGWLTAFGGGYSSTASSWEWLNAYSPTPAVAGTLRQSFLTTVDSLNPFDFTTLWDGYLLSNIYDTLFAQNPECTNSASFAASVGISQCSSILQNIDWMTTSHNFICSPGGPPCTSTTLGYGNSTYFSKTSADLRLSLNRNNHWQDGGPVTAWDVKYSFINLNATGAFQATPLVNVAHINVLDEFTLDLNLKAKGPFTELLIGGITIIPGHVWSACGASTWNNGVIGKNIAGTIIVNAPEDTCVGHFGAPSIATVGGIRADSPTFSVIGNNFLIGSGAYTCQSIGGTGHPPVGTLGGGCSVDNTDTPAGGLNQYTLTRTGCISTSTGTSCGAAGSSSDYFRSSGALAKYIWTGDVGSGSADFSKVLTVNSCHSSTPSINCPHWAQGIGNPSLTSTNNPVGLSQRLAVNSLKGVSWIAFSTEKTTGTQLILSCAAGYTLPGTNLTPCNDLNAGWAGTVLPGIGSYAATIYEVGSQITIGTTTTRTSTLAPAGAVGCMSDYPIGGYDC